MLRRILFVAAASALMLSAAACNPQPTTVKGGEPNGGDRSDTQNVNIGAPLFAPRPAPPMPPVPVAQMAEPIMVPGYITVRDKVDVPSQKDGKILFIGTEVKEAEKAMYAGRTSTFRAKNYRLLEPGERVEPDQVIMLLDDREPYAQLEAARVASESAKDVYDRSIQVRQSAEEIYDLKKKLNDNHQLSPLEFIQGKIELNRALATEVSQKSDWSKATEEYNRAKVLYEMYTIRSNISGILQPFNHKAGEGVRAGETVLQIQSSDILRAEGLISIGYAGRLKRGMPVMVEPTVEEAPKIRRRFHTQAVNGVAVSNHQTPMVVSVSEDKTARVWDGRSDYEAAIFTHPVAVRSVACSPKGSAKHYCLTGSEDGKARLWDLNNPKSGSTPLRVLEGAHKGVISAAAFSPDGRTCATADTRDIALWDVESGKLRYVFPQQHLGEITTLTFTPQVKLVSASHDMKICVWSLGQDGAKLDFTQEGRSGDVERPGVSPDGRYFLLDISQTLRLMTLADRRTEGVVESSNEATKFAAFAMFSPDGKMILTGTQNEGRLSLWRSPTAGNRATELRHYVPRERLVGFTCAAMSPNEADAFAVTGTKNGETYVWPLPSEKEIARIPGTLKFIDQNAAAATRQIRIWAEFPNTTNPPLQIGTNVTVAIEPATGK